MDSLCIRCNPKMFASGSERPLIVLTETVRCRLRTHTTPSPIVHLDPSVIPAAESVRVFNCGWKVRALLDVLSARQAPIVSFDRISSTPIRLAEWSELIEFPSMRSIRVLRVTWMNASSPVQGVVLLTKVA